MKHSTLEIPLSERRSSASVMRTVRQPSLCFPLERPNNESSPQQTSIRIRFGRTFEFSYGVPFNHFCIIFVRTSGSSHFGLSAIDFASFGSASWNEEPVESTSAWWSSVVLRFVVVVLTVAVIDVASVLKHCAVSTSLA